MRTSGGIRRCMGSLAAYGSKVRRSPPVTWSVRPWSSHIPVQPIVPRQPHPLTLAKMTPFSGQSQSHTTTQKTNYFPIYLFHTDNILHRGRLKNKKKTPRTIKYWHKVGVICNIIPVFLFLSNYCSTDISHLGCTIHDAVYSCTYICKTSTL